MASPEQISAWKRQFDGVYSVSMRGVDYIFRALTFDEYDSIMGADESSAEAEELIVHTTLLEPIIDWSSSDVDNLPAGVITSIADEVLNISGYGDPKHAKAVLDKKRAETGDVRSLMKAFVVAVLGYKDTELHQLNYSQLAGKVAFAEQVIEVLQAMYPLAAGQSQLRLDLIDPEEEQEKAQQEAHKHTAQKKTGQAGFNDPIAQKLHRALGG